MRSLDKYKGKRIAGIDFGEKRVGIALSDTLHITASPFGFLDYTSNRFWDDISETFQQKKVALTVIGIPYTKDKNVTAIEEEIYKFSDILKDKTGTDVIFYDESYSSKRASELMITSRVKKKNRAKKGNIDKFAAAIILTDYLNEMQ